VKLRVVFVSLIWRPGLASYCSSSCVGSMVEAVVAAEVRVASGVCSNELPSSGLRRCVSSPHPNLKGVGHPLPMLQSAVQASLSSPRPKWLRSPVVVWWLMRGDFVGFLPESSRT
jgi:hypothetical protein